MKKRNKLYTKMLERCRSTVMRLPVSWPVLPVSTPAAISHDAPRANAWRLPRAARSNRGSASKDTRSEMAERPPSIFISYRGGDETWAPDLVFTSLAAAFGTDAVFKAGYGLRAGQDYPPILERMAAACSIMLVCIGPRWLAAENAAGVRRLDEPTDWVRREIDIALRAGNHVIPLLLGSQDAVVIPPPEELPPDIAPLARRQAFRLEPGGRLRTTLPDLTARLAELVPSLAMRKPTIGTFSVAPGRRRGL